MTTPSAKPTTNFEILQEDLQCDTLIGQGSRGRVFIGKWNGKGGGVTVAIKRVPLVTRNYETIQSEVLSELEILCKFHHPNILPIYGVCFLEREIWIVTEFMEGGNLFELLQQNKNINWAIRLRLALQAAISINVLHESKPPTIHRDIKSLNFAISKDLATLKLTDFGTSKIIRMCTDLLATAPGEALGTTRWRAPEIFNYPSQWSTKSDIYSLGTTFYEIASSETPYGTDCDDDIVVIEKALNNIVPEIPEDCPKEFAQIISECWRFDPAGRPSALDIIKKLQKALEPYASTLAEIPAPSQHSPSEKVITVAGSSKGLQDGNAKEAQFNSPKGICWNPRDSHFYVCDHGNNRIRQVSLEGDVRTFAEVSDPCDIAVHYDTNTLFIVCTNEHYIKKISSSGEVTIFVGSGTEGEKDGTGTNTKFRFPKGIAINQKEGALYVTDSGNKSIREISLSGEVSTFAGPLDGVKLMGLSYDETTQNLLVCDANNKIHLVAPDGEFSVCCTIPSPQFIAVSKDRILVTSSTNKLYSIKLEADKYNPVLLIDGANESTQALQGIVIVEPHCYFVDDSRICKASTA